MSCPSPTSHPSHPAYTLLDEAPLPLWNAQASLLRHHTGARVLSIRCPDDNKTFGIFFPTLPHDDTGLPHILEHCVLCGSEKFPVKEPFKELLKTSLQTYLNAYTYPDRTCYPVASRNLRDFHNLVDVYLDAVFFPRLHPAVLGQEGWRPQWTAQDSLEIQGVVFNEMKGVYASPDARLQELEQRSLLPDTCYRFDYGGDPAAIPNLDFEAFSAFHRRFYHPANAFVGFYGDDDPLERLVRLDAVLSRVPPGEPAPPPELQPGWGFTRKVHATYPTSDDSDEGVFCQLSWLLPGETQDLAASQSTALAAHLLLHSPASPLRLALLESGLGDDILGHAALHLRQPTFSAGLRGVEPGDESRVFSLILHTLHTLARDNFRPDLIEGCLNSTEFSLREMNSSARGLGALNTGLSAWILGGDPLDTLRPEQRLAALRKDWENNPRLFADWIRDHLLDNPHRVEITLRPDPALAARELEAANSRLHALAEHYHRDPDALAAARALADSVDAFQNTPDSPAALASLPRLHLPDVTPPLAGPRLTSGRLGPTELCFTHLDSAGILYTHLAFDFSAIPLEELPLLPLYARCLVELGAGDLDHLAFPEQVACHTGGISHQFETHHTHDGSPDLTVFLLQGKCLQTHIPRLIHLLSLLLASPRLGPPERVRQILLEERATEESDLLHRGNRIVSTRLRAALRPSERAIEEMGGINYLFALRHLETLDAAELRDRLLSLHHRLVHRRGLRLHFAGDPNCVDAALKHAEGLLLPLPDLPIAPRAPWPLLNLSREGLAVVSPVNFVGLAHNLPLPANGSELPACIAIARKLLNSDYLWERVRMRGGAYGVSWSCNPSTGHSVFTSYRDPHIDRTLDTYRSSADWLRTLALDPDAWEQVKIGALGNDPPRKASREAFLSFFRHMTGQTDERRLRRWHELHATVPRQLLDVADLLHETFLQPGHVSILGGRDSLRASGLSPLDVL